jgi:hypothetical protein
MSAYRLQAQVDVPPDTLWELIGNVERHPERWQVADGVVETDVRTAANETVAA